MRLKWAIPAVIFLCILAHGVAAMSVGNIAITPSGNLVSGQTQVRATFVIDFSPSGGKTFDDSNTLQLVSEMEKPVWTYALVIDGVENPSMTEVGQPVTISGWLLSYPAKREVSMKVTMEATAPVVEGTGEKIVFGVKELDSKGKSIASSEVVKKALVINPAQITASIQHAREKLAALKSKVDSARLAGIDTSAVEAKYNEAEGHVQSAEKTSDYSRAQNSLNSANAAIADAEAILSEISVKKEIDDADARVGQVSEVIADLRVNKSMGSDPRLTPIILAHDNAAGLVSAARDALSARDYDRAKAKASEARVKADEALAEALALKEKVESNPLYGVGTAIAGVLIGGVVIVGLIAVVAVVAVAGYLLFRRRRKWDELG